MEFIDFLFFVHIKSFMGGQNCNEYDEVKETVTQSYNRRRHFAMMKKYKN